MHWMFYNCTSLKSIDLSNLDTSKVQEMYNMFCFCSSLEYINLSLKFDTSSVTNMKQMFGDYKKLKSIDLYNFNTSKVESMKFMFYNCENLESIDLSSFDTSKVTTFAGMFQI